MRVLLYQIGVLCVKVSFKVQYSLWGYLCEIFREENLEMKLSFKARSSALPNYCNRKPEFKACVGLWCLLQCYFC